MDNPLTKRKWTGEGWVRERWRRVERVRREKGNVVRGKRRGDKGEDQGIGWKGKERERRPCEGWKRVRKGRCPGAEWEWWGKKKVDEEKEINVFFVYWRIERGKKERQRRESNENSIRKSTEVTVIRHIQRPASTLSA
jgi:hypothetical protein